MMVLGKYLMAEYLDPLGMVCILDRARSSWQFVTPSAA